MGWEIIVDIWRDGVQVGTADVTAESFENLVYQAESELTDWARRNPRMLADK